MIKTYQLFENRDIVTEYIVGFPSGEIIDISSDDDIARLKKENLIKYNQHNKYFVFQDANYHKVKRMMQNPGAIQQIHAIMEKYNVSKYTINSDMSVDVNGNVDLSLKGLTKIPVKFGTINGNFDCSANNLTNLVNSPNEVSGFFDCSGNNIYTLIGGPSIVYGGYYCMDNKLQDLQGYPETCRTSFNCSKNEITTLLGLPQVLNCRHFDISENKLRNLSYGPEITYSFNCSKNFIRTLVNGIREVKGTFDCTFNKLKTLDGMPSCNKILFDEGNQIEELEYD